MPKSLNSDDPRSYGRVSRRHVLTGVIVSSLFVQHAATDDASTLLSAFVQSPASRTRWDKLGWNNGTDPCGTPGWTGVTCSGDHRVTGINLQYDYKLGFEINGSALLKLEKLEDLSVGGTNLSGTIPRKISEIHTLKKLDFGECPRLSGTIPAALGNLSKLEALDLGKTNLSGTIPHAIGNLSNLSCSTTTECENGLELSIPRLSGSLPAELGGLKKLQAFSATSTNMSGTIPHTLGWLSALRTLYLFDNPNITGTIPSELGMLSPALKFLEIKNMGLSGTLPHTFSKLKGLIYVDMSYNPQLSGTISDFAGAAGVPAGCLGGECTYGPLVHLDAGHCSFSSLPMSLPNQIKDLFMTNNPLVANSTHVSSLLSPLYISQFS